MTAAEKKAFALKMAKARAAKAAGKTPAKKKPAKKKPAKRKPAKRKPAKKAAARKPAKKAARRNPAKKAARVTRKKAATTTRKANGGPKSKRKTKRVARSPQLAKAIGNIARRISTKTKAARKAKKHRNPDSADQMYTTFHGRPPARTIEHNELEKYRSRLAELGKLQELRFKLPGVGVITLGDFGSCQAACTPDGTNIYFVGGHQSVDLKALDIDGQKDQIELGECTYIRYFAKKGFHDFEPVEYTHKFGEVDGIRPVLVYDRLNRKLWFVGGNYRCEAAGIVN